MKTEKPLVRVVQRLSTEQLRQTLTMTAEEKLIWLHEANILLRSLPLKEKHERDNQPETRDGGEAEAEDSQTDHHECNCRRRSPIEPVSQPSEKKTSGDTGNGDSSGHDTGC